MPSLFEKVQILWLGLPWSRVCPPRGDVVGSVRGLVQQGGGDVDGRPLNRDYALPARISFPVLTVADVGCWLAVPAGAGGTAVPPIGR